MDKFYKKIKRKELQTRTVSNAYFPPPFHALSHAYGRLPAGVWSLHDLRIVGAAFHQLSFVLPNRLQSSSFLWFIFRIL